MKKKPIKTTEIQSMKFWNDNYELTLLFREKEVVEPEPELPEIPTGINLEFLVSLPLPIIPTNIKAIIQWD